MVDWKQISNYEKHPKVNDVLSNVGDKIEVLFRDDGKLVTAKQIEIALKAKGIKGIKPRDSEVFLVHDEKTKMDMEFWISATNYSALKELKKIADSNGDTLKNKRIVIERVSKGETDKSA